MTPIDIERIKHEAYELRAAEMRRLERIAAERLRLMGHLGRVSAGKGLNLLSESLRPLFSWNPQPAMRRQQATYNASHLHVALATQANRFLRSLFAWNPRPPRHC